ncbi:hypothetical protein [Rivularia sp. UHCC 0363]|uniref:hypothetical protein n=1 Tax=Rivularia sp. UHCC 0363 TaxID=3110244 RepID=UPI002B20EE38|nr:hypothetical protein [Rivularia sp. UHCC 0363]MEA5594761.1 hypothetical protein [Rivularia sp. UHCC 0363]
MKSLSPEEQLLVVSQGFQLLQGQLDKLVETRTTKRIELLSDLLFSKDYPDNYKIETIAKKLNMSVEFLKKLCDRVFES